MLIANTGAVFFVFPQKHHIKKVQFSCIHGLDEGPGLKITLSEFGSRASDSFLGLAYFIRHLRRLAQLHLSHPNDGTSCT